MATLPGDKNKKCEWCSSEFQPRRHWARFCSVACKTKWHIAERSVSVRTFRAHGVAAATVAVNTEWRYAGVNESSTGLVFFGPSMSQDDLPPPIREFILGAVLPATSAST